MKKAIVFALLALPFIASAEAQFYSNGKEVSKLEALKLGIDKQSVMRCQPVYLTDKATFKAVPNNKTTKGVSK